MTLGKDSEFSESRLANRYEKDLANDLGNLLSRLLSMIESYFHGRIPEFGEYTTQEQQLRKEIETLVDSGRRIVADFALNRAVSEAMAAISQINVYLEKTSPWKMVKTGELERTGTVLYTAAEALRIASVLLQPVMPERTAELWKQLGWQPANSLGEALTWGQLEPGSLIDKGAPLFPRIDPKSYRS